MLPARWERSAGTGAEPDGTPMQPVRADTPFMRRFVPRDTPHGIRIVREPYRPGASDELDNLTADLHIISYARYQ